MYYVCVENDQIISVLNYEPSVPDTVTVFEISDEDYDLLSKDTHCFSIPNGRVELKSDDVLQQLELEKQKQEAKTNLDDSDWKVLRHIREKTLGVTTSLSEEEYIELEKFRNIWANFLKQ